MRRPIEIEKNLTQEQALRWEKQFVKTGRSAAEGIWRRTQDERNVVESGRKSPHDKRRRMLHFIDQYGLVVDEESTSLGVIAPYLWMQVASPREEIDGYLTDLEKALYLGQWDRTEMYDDHREFKKDDMRLSLHLLSSDPRDIQEGRTFPADYLMLEAVFEGTNTSISYQQKLSPWSVLNTGIREKDVRGKPTIISDLNELKKNDLFPIQLELGCGPSIEAGVPPLHYLHGIYYVTKAKTGGFIFGPEKDKLLVDIAGNPEQFYQRAALPYVRSIACNPTPFYELMARLHQEGILVGDVITNNFDGLPSLVGLPERYVRRYEETHITPKIEFHPDARSLVVVGSHADRRRIQHSARQQGLKVIYVDPEGYTFPDGSFTSYPLESPQDCDYLIKMTAAEFTDSWVKTFGTKI